jgi:signal peptidase I
MKGGAYAARRAPHRRHLLVARCVLTLVALCVLVLGHRLLPAPVGDASYVITQGVSMEPRFHSGDLAILRTAEEYRVGDVVAYRSDLMQTVVMHRITAVEDGRYSFQGDNNPTVDPETPGRDHLLGTLTMRVPRGGTLLHALTGPTVLGVVIFLLLMAGGGGSTGARRRRTTLTRHRYQPGGARGLQPALPAARGVAGVLVACAVLGLVLASLSWTRTATTMQTVDTESAQSMTFSYRATVPKTPAYDGTTIRSPDPVFRSVADSITVRYAYAGPPGSIAVTAALSTPGGWHSTLKLQPLTVFASSRHTGTVGLDLTELQRRADEAAAVIGIPVAQVEVSLVAAVKTSANTFPAALRLQLTPTELALADGPAGLTVGDGVPARTSQSVSSTLDLAGHPLSVSAARMLSLVLLGGTLLGAALLGLWGRRLATADETTRIRRRLGSRLVRLHKPPGAPTGPVVDVLQVATIVTLAEDYGVPVLQWTDGDVDTFLTRVDGTAYRYQVTTEPAPNT